ncbi:mannonate dehydratase [Frigidibacter sp. ROC022]|uniref:mannonate dehydratase n=1 Tax=Frigidibacter sp. ROC022 TaxID=2971796 RepID=UPI00215A8BA9|nr:mannonate dehydratase [Frigidibacter sp. ROC022]MCR8723503.1 mannonate dehydratase [Frigidibacter sp. ROC022]
MYLGTQLPARDEADYVVMKQLGVDNICADPPGDWRGWDREALTAHRTRIESFGLTLDMIQLPLPSKPFDKAQMPDILSAGPERDAQIAACCQIIADCGKAGIPAVKYNFNYIGIPRSEDEIGRGGVRMSAFRWDRMDHDAPAPLGVLSEDEIWSRIDYFLARVVPAAEAAGVKLACHPHDPYTPPGYRGVTRVLGTVEGLARFIELRKSEVHGLNFCIGTVGEMLEDVSEVPAITRRFCATGKIFNIHLRNIAGGRLSFAETLPDAGDIDLPAVIEALAEGGYKGMVMPDHAPRMDGRDPEGTAFAFSYGYIAALLDRQKRLAAKRV